MKKNVNRLSKNAEKFQMTNLMHHWNTKRKRENETEAIFSVIIAKIKNFPN